MNNTNNPICDNRLSDETLELVSGGQSKFPFSSPAVARTLPVVGGTDEADIAIDDLNPASQAGFPPVLTQLPTGSKKKKKRPLSNLDI